MKHLKLKAFTLIELLIVVAIIAILAAIAVPNFLEAQTRAKVSRVKADMRTISTAAESYYVDNNAYPTGWEINVDPNNPNSHSLFILTTPIAYLSNGDIQDAFVPAKIDDPMWSTLQWDPMTPDGRMFSAFNVDGTYIGFEEKPTWYVLFSVGPDKDGQFTFDLFDGVGTQSVVRDADDDMAAFLTVFYDPTNGTLSDGNIWRAGGTNMNAAGDHMVKYQ